MLPIYVHIDEKNNCYITKITKLFAHPVLLEDEYSHVIEVSKFPVEFKTQDLMMLFMQYKESGFEIKWVDDTHALVIFANAKIGKEINLLYVVLIRSVITITIFPSKRGCRNEISWSAFETFV